MTSQNDVRVGFLGTGLMGRPMVLRLLSEGFGVTVWNRTESKALALENAGAGLSPSPGEVFAASDVVVLMLTDAEAIKETVLTDPAQQHLPGCAVIQMGTISPEESRRIGREVQRAGADTEARSSGSIPEAADGELVVMVGAEPELFEHWLPILKFCRSQPEACRAGGSPALKPALNQLIATITTAYASSLGLVRRSGIDVDVDAEIVRQSALCAPTFDKKLVRMLDRDFTLNFPARHLLKDVRLFAEDSAVQGLFTPHLARGPASLKKPLRGVSEIADDSGWPTPSIPWADTTRAVATADVKIANCELRN